MLAAAYGKNERWPTDEGRAIPLDLLFPSGYDSGMEYKLDYSNEFETWLSRLKDRLSRLRIVHRLSAIELGNFGDHKQIADELFELRMFFGPGFRVYYTIKDDIVVIILAGGDKSSQKSDIAKAKKIMKERKRNDAGNKTI